MIERLSSISYSLPQKTVELDEQKIHKVERLPENLKEDTDKNDLNISVSKEKLQEIVQGMNKFLQPSHTSLKFEFHEKLNEYYVKIVDDKTKETVREIPSKKLLDMYAAMTEFLGLIVDKKI